MKHILVPVNFSGFADMACRYAIQLAKQGKADMITLFHAFHIPVVDPMMPQGYLKDLSESAEKECQSKLADQASKVRAWADQSGLTDLNINSKYVMGFAAEEIVDVVKSVRPDLVVMGTRHEEHKKILLGSVTSAVVDGIKTPLVVVPADAKVPGTISNVLFTSDLEEGDIDSIGTLLELLSPFNVKVQFVHFKTEDDDHFKTLDEFKKVFSEEQQAQMEFKAIHTSNFSEGLDNYVDENPVDMIAMLTHKRPFFVRLFDRSLTKQAAYTHQLPLMVFH